MSPIFRILSRGPAGSTRGHLCRCRIAIARADHPAFTGCMDHICMNSSERAENIVVGRRGLGLKVAIRLT